MNVHVPKIRVLGPAAEHDQSCAVLHGAKAVLDMDSWVFQPSWRAQADGWHLVQARTSWQRVVLRLVFGVRLSARKGAALAQQQESTT